MLASLAALAAPSADLITYLPGFGNASEWPFDAYSGFLTVPGPFELNPYDSLKIHYQFHTSQVRSPVTSRLPSPSRAVAFVGRPSPSSAIPRLR